MDKELIILENVSKKHEGKIILENIDISIRYNQSLVIVGANGSGKSSLLRIIAGLSFIDSGTRTVLEESLKISYVPEHFPKLSFYPLEYLIHMGKIQGLSKTDIQSQVHDFFVKFNISPAMQKTKIRNLSKGSLQKIAVIQALLTEPDILILDEPLSGQDQESQEKFINLLEKLKQQGITIVMACHEQYLVEQFADTVVVIENKRMVSHPNTNQLSRGTIEMVITFTMDDEKAVQIVAGSGGVIDYVFKEAMNTISVKAECSDDLLSKILTMGGSICSVNHAKGRGKS